MKVDIFRILPILLEEVPRLSINEETVEILRDMESKILEPTLFSAFFHDFLWNFNLQKGDMSSKTELAMAKLIKNSYAQNLETS